jgi:DNA gyrase/topoisomerase IV subunit B
VFQSRDGLLDLLTRKSTGEELRYPIIHLKGEDIEIALTHGQHYGEQYYTFVNGQHTTQGGTHLNAFKETLVKTFVIFTKRILIRKISVLQSSGRSASALKNRFLNPKPKPSLVLITLPRKALRFERLSTISLRSI